MTADGLLSNAAGPRLRSCERRWKLAWPAWLASSKSAAKVLMLGIELDRPCGVLLARALAPACC